MTASAMEDIDTKLKDNKRKLSKYKDAFSALSKDEKNRIDSLQQNIKEKLLFREEIDCNKVRCLLPSECIRCEECICDKVAEDTKGIVWDRNRNMGLENP